MNNFHLAVVCFFISQISLHAQSNEIGFSLFQLGNQQLTENSSNPLDLSNQKRNYFNLSPAISYIHIKSNHVELSVQYGFSPYSSKSSQERKFEGSLERDKYNSQYTRQTHTLRFGIGRRNYWKQFVFSSMIYIPISYNFNNKYSNESIRYDQNSGIFRYTKSTTRDPNSFKFGVYIAQSMRYPICKKISVGAELNLGIDQTITYGKQQTVSSYQENNIFIYDIEENADIRSAYTYMNFLPALCLYYSLSPKR